MPQPRETRTTDELRRLYEESLDEIENAVTSVSWRLCLRGDEGEDFRSWVHVKMIERDYRPLRKFAGRSGLATYLVTVVHNLARDYRIRHWGRWRPSAKAEHLGLAAVQLETLTARDGFSLTEATEMLRRHFGVRMSAGEIADLAGRLPARQSVSIESGERVERAEAPERADRAAIEHELQGTIEEARAALADALRELSFEDRLILKMHFQDGLTLAAISVTLDLEQRRLYTRRDRSLRELKAGLTQRGLDADEVLEALEWSGAELKVDFRLTESEA